MATGHDIAMALRAAYWTMHRQTAARLARHRVTADQLVLLALLAEEDGITQQQLVQRASSDPNTIRAMLVRMEDRGLVARRPHPGDGRARMVRITPKGRRSLNVLMADLKPLQQELLSLFEADDANRLVEYLRRISEAMTLRKRRRERPRTATSVATAKRDNQTKGERRRR
jgi:DNA-binding MarR family transcriptional regulator